MLACKSMTNNESESWTYLLIILGLLILKSGQGLCYRSGDDLTSAGFQGLSEEDFEETFKPINKNLKEENSLMSKFSKKHRNVIRMACDSETPIAKMTLKMDFEGDELNPKRHYFVLKKTFNPNKKNEIEYVSPNLLRNKYDNYKNIKSAPNFFRNYLYDHKIKPLKIDEAFKQETSLVDNVESPNIKHFRDEDETKQEALINKHSKSKSNNYLRKWKEALRLKSSSIQKIKDEGKCRFHTDNDESMFYEPEPAKLKKLLVKRIPFLWNSKTESIKMKEINHNSRQNMVNSTRTKDEVNKLQNYKHPEETIKRKEKSHLFQKQVPLILTTTPVTYNSLSIFKDKSFKHTNRSPYLQSKKNFHLVTSYKNAINDATDLFKDLELEEEKENESSTIPDNFSDLETLEATNKNTVINRRRDKVIKNLKFILTPGRLNKEYYSHKDGRLWDNRRGTVLINETNLGDLIDTTEIEHKSSDINDYDLYDYNDDDKNSTVLRKTQKHEPIKNRQISKRNKLNNPLCTDKVDSYESHPIEKSLSYEENLTEGSPEKLDFDKTKVPITKNKVRRVYNRVTSSSSFRRETPVIQKVAQIAQESDEPWSGDVYIPKKYENIYEDSLYDKRDTKRSAENDFNYQKAYSRFLRDIRLFKYLYDRTCDDNNIYI